MAAQFPQLQQQVAPMLPVLAAAAAETEHNGKVDPHNLQQLRERGLLNLLTPTCYGGQALPFTSMLEISRELATACMSTAWVTTVGNVHNWMAAAFEAAAQAEYFANPAVFSAASFAATGQARWVDGGLQASGRWSFLSGVDHADWVFVCGLVQESPADSQPAGPWFMMVPITDVQIDAESWHVAGLSGTGSKDVVLDKVFVPRHRCAFLPQLMADKGPGRGLHAEATFNTAFQPALLAVLAAPMLGAAQQAVQEFTNYTARRVNKITGGKQAEQAPAQIVLAEVAVTVDSAELLLRDIFTRLDTGNVTTPADYARVHRDTAHIGKQLVCAVNTIMQNAGGGALQSGNTIQRIWRDVNAAGNHAALNWATNAQTWGAQALHAQ